LIGRLGLAEGAAGGELRVPATGAVRDLSLTPPLSRKRERESQRREFLLGDWHCG